MEAAQTAFIPKNTDRANKWAENAFRAWIAERNKRCTHDRGREDVLVTGTDEELCQWVSKFLVEARATKGHDYPPSTLHSLLCGLQRIVRKVRPVDFFKDEKFGPLRNVFDNRCRQLHAKGVGTNKQHTATIADEEEEILWEKGVLGSHDPLALLRAVFYLNGKNFCLRGGEEQRSLRREQIIREPSDCEMVAVSYKYVESGSKNNP